MARKWIRYHQSDRLINGMRNQGIKCFDAYTMGPTFQDRLEQDDYGELVDDARYQSAEYDPKKH
jgi:hypothetical protein